jgi:ketosteroid isomerase-like protein
MRKFIVAIGLLSLARPAFSQKGIEGLIGAERAFAAYSVAHGTKAAFLKFLDSAGIMFDKGKAVNGIELWLKREDRPGILNWGPTFAGISQSGDLGFTTGPWTLAGTGTDSIVGSGRFATVWHLDKRGEWKFLVDIGVGNTTPTYDTSVTRLYAPTAFTPGTLASLLEAETEFTRLAAISASAAYRKFFGPGILNRNRDGAVSGNNINKAIKDNVQYTLTGSGIASSNDLGYVYGTTVIDGKTDNYLRVWRKNGKSWEIVMEVLRY